MFGFTGGVVLVVCSRAYRHNEPHDVMLLEGEPGGHGAGKLDEPRLAVAGRPHPQTLEGPMAVVQKSGSGRACPGITFPEGSNVLDERAAVAGFGIPARAKRCPVVEREREA